MSLAADARPLQTPLVLDRDVLIRRLGTVSAVAFVAGFLMLFGARIADGCTSGHGLSGMAHLSVGSTVAVAAMFAGGIATALLLLRRI